MANADGLFSKNPAMRILASQIYSTLWNRTARDRQVDLDTRGAGTG
jgi:hypothetical protein